MLSCSVAAGVDEVTKRSASQNLLTLLVVVKGCRLSGGGCRKSLGVSTTRLLCLLSAVAKAGKVLAAVRVRSGTSVLVLLLVTLHVLVSDCTGTPVSGSVWMSVLVAAEEA